MRVADQGGPPNSDATLTASPEVVAADGNAAFVLTVTLRDVGGSPLAGRQPVLRAVGGNVVLTQPKATAADGTATGEVRSLTAGNVVVRAHFVDAGVQVELPFALTLQFVAALDPAPATPQLALAVAPNAVVANGNAPLRVTLRATTAGNVPLAGHTVRLSSTSLRDFLSPAHGVLDTNNSFQAQLRSTLSGTRTLTASVDDVAAARDYTFVAGLPDPNRCLFVVESRSANADGQDALLVRILVRDAFDNPVVAEVVNFRSLSANAVFVPPAAVSDANGTSVVQVRSTEVGQVSVVASLAGTLRGTDAAGLPVGSAPSGTGSSVKSEVNFVVGPPSAANSTLSASPNVTVAGGNVTLTACVRDAFGNPIEGRTVTFAGTAPGDILSPSSATTSPAGVATAWLHSTRAGVDVATASVGNFTLSANVVVTAASPNATRSALGVAPASQVADNAATVSLTALVGDAYGNPVGGHAVTLTSDNAGGNDTFVPSSGTTDASGNMVATLRSSRAESKSVTATAATARFGATVQFVAGAPNATTSSVSASPNVAVVGPNANAAVLVVSVRDAFFNPVPASDVTLAASGGNNVLQASYATTDDTGTFVGAIGSTTAEAKTVTATLAPSTSVRTVVRFVAGPPNAANCDFSVQPSQQVADNNATVTLRFVLRDDYGNAGANQTASFVSNDVGGNDTIVGSPATGDANGVASATLRSTRAETKLVTAWSESANFTVPVTFVPGAVASARSRLTLSPAQVVADGNAQLTLTATALDAYGNLVPQQNVTFAAPASVSLSAPGCLGDAEARCSVNATSTVAQVANVFAAWSSANVAGVANFVAGPAVAANSNLSLTPNRLVADGNATATLVGRLVDNFNNVCAGQSATAASGGQNVVFVPGATAVADANGQVSLGVRSTTVQNTAVRLVQGANELASGNVAFTLGPPYGPTSSFVASPNQGVAANGNQTVALSGTVRDVLGRTLAGLRVALSAPDPALVVAPGSTVTDANGAFAGTATSRRAGTNVPVARVGTLALRASLGVDAVTPACESGNYALPLPPQPLFAQPNNDDGRWVATGRYNTDVYPDLAVASASSNANNVYVFLGSSTGLGTVPAVNYTVPGRPNTLLIADVDQDNRGDIVVLNDANQVVVLRQGAAQATYGAPAGTGSFCLGDLTGDGFGDIIAVCGSPNSGFAVARNYGDGTFAPFVFTPFGANLVRCAVADFDQDGTNDVLVADRDAANLRLLRGAGNGSLGAAATLGASGCANLGALQAVDFTGDGRADVAVTCSALNGDLSKDYVLSWTNAGAGSFFAAKQWPLTADPRSLYAADVDGDGTLDLVAAAAYGRALLLRGGGDGNFLAATTIGLPLPAINVVAADFNQDGNVDLAYSARYPALGVTYARGHGVFPSVVTRPEQGAAADDIYSPERVLHVGDLNLDGRPDFVSIEWNRAPKVYLSQGSYNWVGTRPGAPDTAFAVAGGDFRGTGLRTLVQGNFYNGNLCLYPNASGTLGTCTNTPATDGYRWEDIVGGDINGDGLDDVVGTLAGSSRPLQSYLSVGDGSFVAGPTIDPGGVLSGLDDYLTSVSLVDLASRGVLDLLVHVNGRLYVLRNAGDGTFSLAQTWHVNVSPRFPSSLRPTLADINGDGFVDVITPSTASLPYIFLNDGSGLLRAPSDPAGAGSQFQTLAVLAVDVDQDGQVDLVTGVWSYGQPALLLRKGRGDGTFAEQPTTYPTLEAFMVVGGTNANTGVPSILLSNIYQEQMIFLEPQACVP